MTSVFFFFPPSYYLSYGECGIDKCGDYAIGKKSEEILENLYMWWDWIRLDWLIDWRGLWKVSDDGWLLWVEDGSLLTGWLIHGRWIHINTLATHEALVGANTADRPLPSSSYRLKLLVDSSSSSSNSIDPDEGTDSSTQEKKIQDETKQKRNMNVCWQREFEVVWSVR